MLPMTMDNHYVIDYVRAKGAGTNETPPVGPGKHSENTTVEALARSMAVDKEGPSYKEGKTLKKSAVEEKANDVLEDQKPISTNPSFVATHAKQL
ncbi:hypothetical protein Acr_28g0004940 [Actinidia rufa]|uniref:Uncharacterized protein n=1 Tax=Actinidia rufa TaxID=165716 RepID=A0A7J0H9P6_9ERIC|nr:hypothetical protein Acr_28g0004940 [Actinidia rufa]